VRHSVICRRSYVPGRHALVPICRSARRGRASNRQSATIETEVNVLLILTSVSRCNCIFQSHNDDSGRERAVIVLRNRWATRGNRAYWMARLCRVK